ncbi:MAG: DUF3256 family protein [Bacteroidaceae bacterium]|nr:DUF3256 family protein [Bacteroidaceae bacterium]
MKNNILALFVGVLLIPSTSSAQDLKTIIRQMPDSILPTLSKNNVLDFVDYKDSNMKAVVTNNLGGKSEMTELTDSYAFIRTSANSDVQIKLLPLADSQIISLIRSVSCDTIKTDSQIEFYTTDWKLLNASDYFTFSDTTNFAHYIQNTSDTSLTIRFINPLELDEKAKPRESITLKWNGKKYEEGEKK